MANKPKTHNICIDTSFFESNLFLEGNRVKALSDLVHKYSVKLHITDIIKREVINRYRKRVNSANASIKSVLKEIKRCYVLKNSTKFDPYIALEKLDQDEIIKEFTDKLDKWIVDNNVIVIPTGHIQIADIMDDYFNHRLPFQDNEKKKCEFPDAFTVKAIEEHFSNLKQKTYFIASDGDITQIPEGTIIPLHSDKAPDLYDLIIRHETQKAIAAGLVFIDKFFNLQTKVLLTNIQKELEETIEKEVESTAWIDGTKEVESLSNLKLNNVLINQSSIINLNLDDHSAIIECLVSFDYELDIDITDYEFASYDNEDNIYFGLESSTYTKKDSTKTKVAIVAYFDIAANICDFEIESINDGQDLDLLVEDYY